jgi:hypothetical protein
MGIILGIIFLAIAVVAAAAFGGTPHTGPTTTCGPITIFNQTFTANTDCRYVSVAEGVVAIVFFLLALFAVLSARPRG